MMTKVNALRELQSAAGEELSVWIRRSKKNCEEGPIPLPTCPRMGVPNGRGAGPCYL
jgi:hypothetical protein